MSIKSNDALLSEVSFESDQDLARNSEESDKTTLAVTAKTLEESYDELSEKEANPSSKDPPLEEVDLEAAPPTTYPPSTTKTNMNDVKVTDNNTMKNVSNITKKVKLFSSKIVMHLNRINLWRILKRKNIDIQICVL